MSLVCELVSRTQIVYSNLRDLLGQGALSVIDNIIRHLFMNYFFCKIPKHSWLHLRCLCHVKVATLWDHALDHAGVAQFAENLPRCVFSVAAVGNVEAVEDGPADLGGQ